MGVRFAALIALVAGCSGASPAPVPVKPPVEAAAEPEHFVLRRRIDRSDLALGESGLPVGCALSSDGQRLAVPSNPPLIWDFALDKPLPSLGKDDSYTLAVAFGSTSRELAVGTLAGLDFWDLERKQKQSVPDEDGTTGYRLAYDGHVVALLNMALGILSLYHDKDHARFAHINRNGHWGGAKSGQFPDIALAGGRVAVPLDTAVELFDTRDGSSAGRIAVPVVAEAVALSADGAHLAVALSDSIALYALASPSRPRSAPIAGVSALSFTPTKLLYGTSAGAVGSLDLPAMKPAGTIERAHHGRVACVRARGERVVSSSTDGTAVWAMPRSRARE